MSDKPENISGVRGACGEITLIVISADPGVFFWISRLCRAPAEETAAAMTTPRRNMTFSNTGRQDKLSFFELIITRIVNCGEERSRNLEKFRFLGLHICVPPVLKSPYLYIRYVKSPTKNRYPFDLKLDLG